MNPGVTALIPKSFLLAVLALQLVSGCRSEGESFRAIYYWGAEVNVVCPCGTQACFWLRAAPEDRSRLRTFVENHTETPYQGIFLVFEGHRLAETGTGFAADYDGLMKLERILSMTAEFPGDCPPP